MKTFTPTFTAPARTDFERANPELLEREAVMTTDSGKVISINRAGALFCDNAAMGYGLWQDDDGMWSIHHCVKGRNYAQGTTKFAATRIFVEGV